MRFSITIFLVGERVGLEAHSGGESLSLHPFGENGPYDQIGSEMYRV